ncbi:DinB family protein [Streptomonospora sp. PA3]|uniref:DinB family protein n=1 Tax=Streptomonospora sp. PA3 TaxID=2607326 RepID=UPI0012DDDF51|nr:DinB family protein [Streptomonospora sp. PA3]MUL40602.1 DinB family protein [Streptomonospora sp. PA3]
MTATATPTSRLGSERADLLAELATAREALIGAVRGLDDEQIRLRPTVSALCLGGLVKHVASTEEAWLRFAVEGPAAMRFDLPDGVTWDDLMAGTARELPQWIIDRENDFAMLPGDTLEGILRRYERVAERTEEVVASLPDLSATHPLPEAPWSEPGAEYSVRRVLIHVIAETTQHAGHADILRETIDGRTAT